MIKKVKKKLKNQGNSFLVVVVCLSFLAILTAALLVAIALCYRLKIMDINSRDNFYYLEQAMDEIYAGVGADSIQKLNEAYADTLETIVYYDTDSKSYVTMDNDVANKLLKKTYMTLMREDTEYKEKDTAEARIQSFITNKYSASSKDASGNETGNPEGVQCKIDNVDVSVKDEDDNITILNLVLTRTAKYSTNTIGKKGLTDEFTQTISTDLVIGEPQFDVSFNTIDASMNTLFSFSMIADRGIEITNAKVNVAGDVYAASDFYNKDYNGNTNKSVSDTVTSQIVNSSDTADKQKSEKKVAAMYTNKVYSGDDSTQDGVNEKSMYSGIYMSGSEVVFTSNKLIVPGSIAAMNASKLTVSAISGNRLGKTEIWADSIVLGGYSLKKSQKADAQAVGSDVTLNANCYISDDLEVNATGASLALIGEYYGYNNSTTDNRSFTSYCLSKNGVNQTYWDSADAKEKVGQAHYNSSSIIINGENASLDLKDVSALYIAGQAYIELSKQTTKTEEDIAYTSIGANPTGSSSSGDSDGSTEMGSDGSGVEKNVEVKTFSYAKKSADGTDYYTTDSDRSYSSVQDYKTGEAVSIKSNQLAYIPPSAIQESDGQYYVTLPDSLLSVEPFASTWPKDAAAKVKEAVSQIPVVKSVISGKTYYYFDFANAKTAKTVEDADGNSTDNVVGQFIEAYTKIFESGSSASAILTDITNYDDFQVNMLKLPTLQNSDTTDYSKIYSNAALTVKSGSKFSVKASSDAMAALEKAANTINTNDSDKLTDQTDTVETIAYSESSDKKVLASNITKNFQKQYKEAKLLLSAQSSDSAGVEVASKIGESAITPINHYFKFSVFGASGSKVKDIAETNLEKSGYGLWTNDGDVEINPAKSSSIKGVIICMGDVKFGANVKSFEGLIVCGGKVYIDHNMDFVANEEVIKSVLRICEDNQDEVKYKQVLMLFRSYGGDEENEDLLTEDAGESTKTISTIQYEDILEFSNWKKNVD